MTIFILLTSEGCVAECILGIEPGRTTREQVTTRFGVANVSALDGAPGIQ